MNNLQMCLGNSKYPLSFSLGNSVELTINDKCKCHAPRKAWIPPPGRTTKLRQCWNKTQDFPRRFTINIPTSEFVPCNTPFIIESSNLENFRLVFAPKASTEINYSRNTPSTPFDKVIESYNKQKCVLECAEKALEANEIIRESLSQNLKLLKKSMNDIGLRINEIGNQDKFFEEKFNIIQQIGPGVINQIESISNTDLRKEIELPRKTSLQSDMQKMENLLKNVQKLTGPVLQKDPATEQKTQKLISTLESGQADSAPSTEEDLKESLNNQIPMTPEESASYELAPPLPPPTKMNQSETAPTTLPKQDSKFKIRVTQRPQKTEAKRNIIATQPKKETPLDALVPEPRKNTVKKFRDSVGVENVMKELADNVRKSKIVLDTVSKQDEIVESMQKKYVQDAEKIYLDQQNMLEELVEVPKISNDVQASDISSESKEHRPKDQKRSSSASSSKTSSSSSKWSGSNGSHKSAVSSEEVLDETNALGKTIADAKEKLTKIKKDHSEMAKLLESGSTIMKKNAKDATMLKDNMKESKDMTKHLTSDSSIEDKAADKSAIKTTYDKKDPKGKTKDSVTTSYKAEEKSSYSKKDPRGMVKLLAMDSSTEKIAAKESATETSYKKKDPKGKTKLLISDSSTENMAAKMPDATASYSKKKDSKEMMERSISDSSTEKKTPLESDLKKVSKGKKKPPTSDSSAEDITAKELEVKTSFSEKDRKRKKLSISDSSAEDITAKESLKDETHDKLTTRKSRKRDPKRTTQPSPTDSSTETIALEESDLKKDPKGKKLLESDSITEHITAKESLEDKEAAKLATVSSYDKKDLKGMTKLSSSDSSAEKIVAQESFTMTSKKKKDEKRKRKHLVKDSTMDDKEADQSAAVTSKKDPKGITKAVISDSSTDDVSAKESLTMTSEEKKDMKGTKKLLGDEFAADKKAEGESASKKGQSKKDTKEMAKTLEDGITKAPYDSPTKTSKIDKKEMMKPSAYEYTKEDKTVNEKTTMKKLADRSKITDSAYVTMDKSIPICRVEVDPKTVDATNDLVYETVIKQTLRNVTIPEMMKCNLQSPLARTIQNINYAVTQLLPSYNDDLEMSMNVIEGPLNSSECLEETKNKSGDGSDKYKKQPGNNKPSSESGRSGKFSYEQDSSSVRSFGPLSEVKDSDYEWSSEIEDYEGKKDGSSSKARGKRLKQGNMNGLGKEVLSDPELHQKNRGKDTTRRKSQKPRLMSTIEEESERQDKRGKKNRRGNQKDDEDGTSLSSSSSRERSRLPEYREWAQTRPQDSSTPKKKRRNSDQDESMNDSSSKSDSAVTHSNNRRRSKKNRIVQSLESLERSKAEKVRQKIDEIYQDVMSS